MARGRKIQDMRSKMALAERKLKIKTDEDWAEALNYAHVSSISRLRTGESNVTDAKLTVLCSKLHILDTDFDLGAKQFGVKLGLSSAEIDSVLLNCGSKKQSVHNISKADIDLMEALTGNYVHLYLCNEEHDPEVVYLALEKIEISRREESDFCDICQYENLMTGENPSGRLQSKNGRIVANLEYKINYYPDSILYLDPIILHNNGNILSGIYIDITADDSKEIFATRTVLVQVSDFEKYTQKYFSDSEMYRQWREVLMYELDVRNRMASPFGFSYKDLLRKTSLATIQS